MQFQELLHSTTENSRQISPAQEVLTEFQVRVPRHWDFSVCSSPAGQRRTTYARPSQDTDILIGRSHPLFGSRPWSLQNEGCAKRGNILNLPFAFLTQSVPDLVHKGGCKAGRAQNLGGLTCKTYTLFPAL